MPLGRDALPSVAARSALYLPRRLDRVHLGCQPFGQGGDHADVPPVVEHSSHPIPGALVLHFGHEHATAGGQAPQRLGDGLPWEPEGFHQLASPHPLALTLAQRFKVRKDAPVNGVALVALVACYPQCCPRPGGSRVLRLPLPGSRRRLPDGFPLHRVEEADRIGRKVLQVEGAEQRLEPVELFPAAVAFVQTFNPPIRMA